MILIVSVIGAGTMGSGIAQVAASYDCEVTIVDSSQKALENSKSNMQSILNRLIEKGKIGKVEDVNFEYVQDWSEGKTINKKNSKKMFRWKLDKKIVGTSTVLNEL